MSNNIIKKVIFAGAILFLLAGLVKYGPNLLQQVAKADPWWLGGAFVLCLIYRLINAAGWSFVLRALGHPLPVVRGTRLWLVSETMRWLPGSVWGFASRVYQATEAGVPARIASLSLPVELVLTVVAWAVTAVAGIAVSGVATDMLTRFSGSTILGVSAACVGLPVLLIAVLMWLPENKLSRKVRNFVNDLKAITHARPNWRLLGETTLFYVGLCVLNGLAFFALVRALTPAAPSFAAVTGINAVGWLVGFFAIAAPGGIGVREGGMTALLAPLTGLPVAVASVVLWRGLQIVVELLCLAGCLTPRLLATPAPRLNQTMQAEPSL